MTVVRGLPIACVLLATVAGFTGARQFGETTRTNRCPQVPVSSLLEPSGLMLLSAVRLHDPSTLHGFAHYGRHLSAFFERCPRARADLHENRTQREDHHRRDEQDH